MPSGSKPGENHGGGRKRQPLTLKQSYTPPDERKQREQAEESMKLLADIEVSPPDYLDDLAKQTWLRLIPEIKKLPLKYIDQSTLEQFCSFYSTYVQANQILKANGVLTPDGNRKNPAFQIMKDSAQSMRQCGSELGFNFSSRMSMLIPKEDKTKDNNPFSSGLFGDINA